MRRKAILTALILAPYLTFAIPAQAQKQVAAPAVEDATEVSPLVVEGSRAKPKWKSAWVDENRCSTHYETGSRIRTITVCDNQDSVDRAWMAQRGVQAYRQASAINVPDPTAAGPAMGDGGG